MFLSFIKVFSIFLLAIFLGVFILIMIALIRTMTIKNTKIKVLIKNSLSSEKIEEYKSNMEYLFNNELIDALPYLFPCICDKGEFVKFDNSFLFVYRNNKIETDNILINVPIKSFKPNKITFDGQNAVGKNTYNSKSHLYSIFDALETIALSGKEINENISIAVYEREETNNDIINYLFEKNEKFNLVIGEGGKILDPITTSFRSFYAFVGVGVNEKVTIRYRTKKIGKGKERLFDFLEEIKDGILFETRIDSEAIPAIRKLSKEMLYGNRFILNNIAWLPKLGKRIVEEELLESNKAWKTHFECGEIMSDENSFFVDIDFYLSSSENENDIISAFNKKVIKYSLEYDIISKEEKCRGATIHSSVYRNLASIIENVFQELYITSYILNEDVYDRGVEKVGENVIRFIPLYYSRDAIIGEKTNNEWVSFSSIDKAISFYEEFFLNFRRK